MMLPLPFARVVCRFGRPLAIDPKATRSQETSSRVALDGATNSMTDELDARLGVR